MGWFFAIMLLAVIADKEGWPKAWEYAFDTMAYIGMAMIGLVLIAAVFFGGFWAIKFFGFL